MVADFQAAGRTNELSGVDWREVQWDYAYALAFIRWWQDKSCAFKPVVWLPSNGIPEVDIYLLLAVGAMTNLFNVELLDLPDEANRGESALLFKVLSKLSRGSVDDGEEGTEETGATKQMGQILVDISMASKSPRYRPYAVACMPEDATGTSLRRGGLREMRRRGVPRDICADTTGHSTCIPGGFTAGTVPQGSAQHNYDEVDDNDVIHGTMALGDWPPPIGPITHIPQVATLGALEGTVSLPSLHRVAVSLFRIDASVTPPLDLGKRLEPLLCTMLAHCIMYSAPLLDRYGPNNLCVSRLCQTMIVCGLATPPTVVATVRDWSSKVTAAFRAQNLPLAMGRGGQSDIGPLLSAVEAMNTRMHHADAAAIARHSALEKQLGELRKENLELRSTLGSVLSQLDRVGSRGRGAISSLLPVLEGGGVQSSPSASSGGTSGADRGGSASGSGSAESGAEEGGFVAAASAAVAASKASAASSAQPLQLGGIGVNLGAALQLSGAAFTMDVLWATRVSRNLTTAFQSGLSDPDHRRLVTCETYMRAVASPSELLSIASLAPGAPSPAHSVQLLGNPATVARNVSRKLFQRLGILEARLGLKVVKSRACTVNACLERVDTMAKKSLSIRTELSTPPSVAIVLAPDAATSSKEGKKRRRVAAAAEAGRQEAARMSVGGGGGSGTKKPAGGKAPAVQSVPALQCELCSFTTTLPGKLQTHMEIHAEEDAEGEDQDEEDDEDVEEEEEEEDDDSDDDHVEEGGGEEGKGTGGGGLFSSAYSLFTGK